MSAWTTACKWTTIITLLFLVIPIKIQPSLTKLQFDEYIKKFNKTYVQGTEEYDKRFQIFKHTLQTIDKLNANRPHNETAKYGPTPFSDLTEEEFMERHLDQAKRLTAKKRHRNRHKFDRKVPKDDEIQSYGYGENSIYRRKRAAIPKDIPPKIDWREKSIISPVKDQGLCGACWAFSTIHTIESIAAIIRNKLVPLSVQQSVDCAGYGNFGCLGGDICKLLFWLYGENVTLATENDYPTVGKGSGCYKTPASSGIRIGGFVCDSMIDKEEQLLRWISSNGPIAVAINALSWQNYLGGVIQYHCPGDLQSLNHAVEIVGYDLTAEIPYYIAKNSWGTNFGTDGYLHLAIGENICGLANEVAMIDLKFV